jgi:transposase-like protein
MKASDLKKWLWFWPLHDCPNLLMIGFKSLLRYDKSQKIHFGLKERKFVIISLKLFLSFKICFKCSKCSSTFWLKINMSLKYTTIHLPRKDFKVEIITLIKVLGSFLRLKGITQVIHTTYLLFWRLSSTHLQALHESDSNRSLGLV